MIVSLPVVAFEQAPPMLDYTVNSNAEVDEIGGLIWVLVNHIIRGVQCDYGPGRSVVAYRYFWPQQKLDGRDLARYTGAFIYQYVFGRLDFVCISKDGLIGLDSAHCTVSL
jgi:hypothetical protein